MNALVDPGAIGMNIFGAFKAGQQEREKADYKNALTQYAMAPSEQGLAPLAQHAPEFVIQERGRLQEQQQRQLQADLQRRAAQGDPAAVAELAGVDLDAWAKLDTRSKQATAERVSVIGEAALAVSQLPPEQRPQAWDMYISQLSQQYPELASQRGQYSEQALMGALASAKQMKTFIDLEMPKYMAIPAGGTLVDTRNPQAVQQFGQGPQPGMVEDGYRFKGGNPADPNAWEPVAAGGAGSGQQGFQR